MDREKNLLKYMSADGVRNVGLGFLVFAVLMALAEPMMFFVFGIWAAFLLLAWLIGIGQRKGKINAFRNNGALETVLSDFENAKPVLNGKVRAGENYIFFKGSGIVLLYTEILWVYRFTQRYLFIPIKSTAMIGDAKGKVKGLCSIKSGNKAGAEQIKELAAVVQAKNPNVILGYDADRQKRYRALVKNK